jgi:hypothetical protein
LNTRRRHQGLLYTIKASRPTQSAKRRKFQNKDTCPPKELKTETTLYQVKALQKNKAGAEHSRHDRHKADSGRGEAELEGLEASGSTLGASAGSSRATAGSSGDITGALGGSGGGLGASVLGALSAEAIALAGAVGQVFLGGDGDGRESIGGDIPVGLGLDGAAGGTAGGVVFAVTAGVLGLAEGGLESIVVLEGGDIVAVDFDETVLVAAFGVLVGQTAGVDAGHLGGVQSGDFLPLTGVGVAAVLGEEEGDAVAGEVLDLLVPAGGGEGRGVAPGVVVEGEEVRALVVAAAVHVLGHLETVGVDIGGGVADGNLAKLVAAQESAHVTGDGLDVGSGLGGGAVVDNLVSGEEGKGVVVLGELLHGGEDVLEVDIVVGGLGVRTVKRVLGGVDVEDEVDASVSESVHALVVVGGVVDGVDTDSVQAEILEVLDVTLAALSIGDGIGELGGTTGLVVHTTDVEAVIALEEGVTLDSDRSDAAITGLEVGSGTENTGRAESHGRSHGGDGGLHNVGEMWESRGKKRKAEIC